MIQATSRKIQRDFSERSTEIAGAHERIRKLRLRNIPMTRVMARIEKESFSKSVRRYINDDRGEGRGYVQATAPTSA